MSLNYPYQFLFKIIKDNGGQVEVDLLDARCQAAGWWNVFLIKPFKVVLDAISDGFLEVGRDEKRNQIIVLTDKTRKEVL